jgi:ferredoxin-NADP reductase
MTRVTQGSGETESTVVVAGLRTVADGVRELTLVPSNGTPLPSWAPGAHIDLILDDGLVRQYSLCGPVEDHDHWTVAVLREPEGTGGSAYVHDKLEVGDRLLTHGPRNHFPWEPGGEHVFVAGGIGITPIVPMLAAADAAGVEWVLHYGGRTRDSMAYADELAERYGDRVVLHPQDVEGLLDLPAILGGPREGLVVHACGPPALLDALEEACQEFPEGTLHLERFVAAEGAHDAGDRFEVELASDGRVLEVGENESILEVLERAGVDILSSCREGTCGTCETDVLEGRVEHRDTMLTPAERAANDVMFVCVSRAEHGCPRLVIDR